MKAPTGQNSSFFAPALAVAGGVEERGVLFFPDAGRARMQPYAQGAAPASCSLGTGGVCVCQTNLGGGLSASSGSERGCPHE